MPVLETVKSASEGWSLTTLEQHLTSIIEGHTKELKAIMDERDRLYKERWESQQDALAAALLAAKEAVTAALTAQKEAVTKAEEATNKRLEGMNEFRDALSDAAGKSIPRVEFDRVVDGLNAARTSAVESLGRRIEELKSYKDTASGKVIAIGSAFTGLIAVISIGLAVMSYLRNS